MKHEEGSGEMNGPRVSVVMPAKNEAGAIEAVVRSVRQHVPGAEVIVFMDTDGRGDVARALLGDAKAQLAPQYPFVGRRWRHELSRMEALLSAT
jgi:hypothetical protein